MQNGEAIQNHLTGMDEAHSEIRECLYEAYTAFEVNDVDMFKCAVSRALSQCLSAARMLNDMLMLARPDEDEN